MSPESVVAIQKSLPLIDRPTIVHSENIRLKTPAVEIFKEVLRGNPKIAGISYVEYDPSWESDYADLGAGDADFQVPMWVEASECSGEFLQQLSLETKEQTLEEITVPGEETIKIYNGIAICSQVLMKDGEILHIPMLDLSEEIQEGVEFRLVEDMLSEYCLPAGYILETDNAGHYWSLSLMTKFEWECFMRRIKEIDEERVWAKNLEEEWIPYFDPGFMRYSLERGFSALRVFAYPPDKVVEPRVVQFIR